MIIKYNENPYYINVGVSIDNLQTNYSVVDITTDKVYISTVRYNLNTGVGINDSVSIQNEPTYKLTVKL